MIENGIRREISNKFSYSQLKVLKREKRQSVPNIDVNGGLFKH